MKKFAHYFMFMGLACLAASCMEEADMPQSEATESDVLFIIEDFVPETQTKSAFDSSTMEFQWSVDDAIGIFPEVGWQTEYVVEDGAGGNAALFDGGSWGLKSDATYYAYYPFSEGNFTSRENSKAVAVSYEGQEAAFADAGGIVKLGRWDHMASGASTVVDGKVTFNFKHLGALCKLSFKSPVTTGYSSVTLKTSGYVFLTSGTFDATAEEFALTPKMKSNSFAVNIDPDKVFEAGSQVDMYFLMPPTDLSGQTVTATLTLSNTESFDYSLDGKNIEAGKSYGWDLGEIEIEDCYDPSSNQATANCYIVSEAGTYSFPTVKGNGFAYIRNIASAEVLWESFGTAETPEVGALISSVSYAGNQVTYTVPAEYKEGNALIAVKDETGKILWAWHIWLTDKPAEQVYRNNAGTMLDRNLGATSAEPGEVGALGLMYQWGRKDPFLGSSSISESVVAASTLNPWPAADGGDYFSGVTIEQAIASPTTFFGYDTFRNTYDWLLSANGKLDHTRWQDNKTIYDPCPAGYRVPDGGREGIWAKALGTAGGNQTFDSVNKGYNLGKSETAMYFTEEAVCWYPLAGAIGNQNGAFTGTGNNAQYWSCTYDGDIGSYCLCLSTYWNVSWLHIGGTTRNTAFPIRCQKIQ